jgi:hypothetical protein
MGLVVCYAGGSTPVGLFASLLTATLYCALLVWHAIACSLTASTIPGALLATLAFPLVAMGGTALLIGIFERHHGPAFWIVAGAALVGTWWWGRTRSGLGVITAQFISVHLALTAVATCWTYQGRRDEFPVAAMQPGFLVVSLLDDRPENWFRSLGRSWPEMIVCYCLALVVNLVWARRRLIRHFDEWSGRISGAARVTKLDGGPESSASLDPHSRKRDAECAPAT